MILFWSIDSVPWLVRARLKFAERFPRSGYSRFGTAEIQNQASDLEHPCSDNLNSPAPVHVYPVNADPSMRAQRQA